MEKLYRVSINNFKSSFKYECYNNIIIIFTKAAHSPRRFSVGACKDITVFSRNIEKNICTLYNLTTTGIKH